MYIKVALPCDVRWNSGSRSTAVCCRVGCNVSSRAGGGRQGGSRPEEGSVPSDGPLALQGGLEEESGAGMDPRSWREDGEGAPGAGEMFTNERSQRVIGFGQIKRGTLC